MTTNHTPHRRQEAAMSETTEAPRGAWVDAGLGTWLLYPPGIRGLGSHVGWTGPGGWYAYRSPFAGGSEPGAFRLVERTLCAAGVRYERLDGRPWPEEAPSPEAAPVTREELDALAARVAALEATTAATPEPASAAARERTREDVATAPVVGDVVRSGQDVWTVTVARGRLVHTESASWTYTEWAALVRDPATDVLPMRRPA